MKNTRNNNNGFMLLLSLLISGLILGISVGLPVFIIKELQISSLARESQKAFFAADGGAECALFWDIKKDAFATTTSFSTINCSERSISIDPSSGVSTFTLGFSNGSCAVVTVNKIIETYPWVRIESYGRNVGDSNCDSNDFNRVERALKITIKS